MDFNVRITDFNAIPFENHGEKFFGTLNFENTKELVEYLVDHFDKVTKILVSLDNGKMVEFNEVEHEKEVKKIVENAYKRHNVDG